MSEEQAGQAPQMSEKEQAEVVEQIRAYQKSLKQLSKNDLVRTVINQTIQIQRLQYMEQVFNEMKNKMQAAGAEAPVIEGDKSEVSK